MTKTRKEVGVRAKKALNYGKQGWKTANENIAGTPYKGLCNKACKGEPVHGRRELPLTVLAQI